VCPHTAKRPEKTRAAPIAARKAHREAWVYSQNYKIENPLYENARFFSSLLALCIVKMGLLY